ncbi:MAG: hypothetical protein KDI71_19385 [Xanthomonadales bacterium]|nr:hypothetical protein [Xanthomonadales bacterium]
MKSMWQAITAFALTACAVTGQIHASAEGPQPERISEEATRLAALAEVSAAERFELLAIDTPEENEPRICPQDCFLRWKQYGLIEVAEPGEIEVIRAELLRWLNAPAQDGTPMCFFPHHGVRIQTELGWLEFAICYDCGMADVVMSGLNERVYGHAAVYLESERTQLDEILVRHGIAPRGLEDLSD